MSERAGLAACLGLALAAPAGAEEIDFARIVALETVGAWSEGALYGEVRLITQREGFETTRDVLYVDWTLLDADTGSARVIATRRLAGCDGAGLPGGAVTAARQEDLGSPVSLALAPDGRPVSLSLGAPGTVTLTGC